MRLAKNQAIVCAQSLRGEQRRAGIDAQRSVGIARADRIDVAPQRRGRIGIIEHPPDAVAPFAGLAGFHIVERVAAASRVRVEMAQRLFLRGHRVQHRQQDRVLEHVREVAGMEGVAVIHASVRCIRQYRHGLQGA